VVDKRAFDALGGRLAAPLVGEQVCISIPVNLIPHLLGALEPLRWPDVWSGEDQQVNRVTGEIETLLGRLIARSRCDVPDCPDCPDCPDVEPPAVLPSSVLGTASDLEESEDMGQVVTDVQIINGQLRVFFGPCCYRDLGSIQDIIDSGTESDIDPPWEDVVDDPVYSACAKATAIVEAIYDLVEIGFTQTDNGPWQYIGNIEGAFGYDLDNNWVLTMMGDIMFNYLTSNMSFGDTMNSDQKQSIKASIAALLADDSSGVPTDTLFQQIRLAFGSVMTFDNYGPIYTNAIDAIGRRDLDAIAKTGALENTSYDCTPVTIPTVLFDGYGADLAWRYVWDLRAGVGNWTIGTSNHWEDGVGVWGDSGTTQNYVNILLTQAIDQLNNGSTITMIGVAFELIGDENYDPGECQIGTEDVQLMTSLDWTAVTGNNPTVPGFYQFVKGALDPLGGTETQLRANIRCYHPEPGVQHPDELAYSHRMVGLLFGGTGPGPLSSPPA
jgi:hypothetical protein